MRFTDMSPVTFYAIWWPDRNLIKVGICWNNDRIIELLQWRMDLPAGVIVIEDRKVPKWWEKAALKRMHETFQPAFSCWQDAYDDLPGGRGFTEAFVVPDGWTAEDLEDLIDEGIYEYGQFRDRYAAGVRDAALRRHADVAGAVADPPRAARTPAPVLGGTRRDWLGRTRAADGCVAVLRRRGVARGHHRGAAVAPGRDLRAAGHGPRCGALPPAPRRSPLHSRNQWQGRESARGCARARERERPPETARPSSSRSGVRGLASRAGEPAVGVLPRASVRNQGRLRGLCTPSCDPRCSPPASSGSSRCLPTERGDVR